MPRWGLGDVLLGFLVGFVASDISELSVAAASGLAFIRGAPARATPAMLLAGLLALWVGLAGVPLLVSRRKGNGPVSDFGLVLRPWPDLPLGVLVGLASQYLLIPVLYLPLQPLIPHLNNRLSQPAQSFTGGAHGALYVALALLAAAGAPVVEELFFRGLLLRSLLKRLVPIGPRLAPVVSIVVSAVAFGLAHQEGLQLLGLAAFGVVLGALAYRFGRLGPGMAAHAAFNTAAIVTLALGH